MVSSEMAENSPSPHHEAPSPQCVGREFVRQYYTLLAEAPHFMYRFFSNESIFVHGSDEEIVGQNAIEKKIAGLGFHDCRTRIRVLDSHETIGKGVVVQVVGEITVNGDMSAMRRFVQTFVLAPQSEKKYYVYNDIFRYEDDLFKEADGKDKDGENDSGAVPDPPARPLEQRPPRGMSNGGTHGGAEELDYYTMLPGQPQPQQATPGFQTSMANEQGIETQLSQAAQPTPGYGAPAPLPQRTAAAPDVPSMTFGAADSAGGAWSAGSTQLPQPMSSVAFAPTGPAADAHHQHYAQPSQQPQLQHTSPASFNVAMPSQSPVPSSNVAPQVSATAPPVSDTSRPQSAGKDSPGLVEEQDQQPRDTAMASSWASKVKKPNKGPQQPPTNFSASGPPQISPGQNVQPRPPMDAPMPGGPPPQRWAPQQSNYPPLAWEQQQQQQQQQYPPRQYRASFPPEFGGGGQQSQDARASPAPSGGGGGGRGQNIPPDEGVYLKNVPTTATEEALRNALTETGVGVKDVRIVRKEGIAFAFVHLDSVEYTERLLNLGSLKMDDIQIAIQQLRRNDMPYMGRPGAGTGSGSGYQYAAGMGRGGGRGGRGNMAQRGGERGGRGSRGGGNAGGRMFMAGGGNRGGGSFQSN